MGASRTGQLGLRHMTCPYRTPSPIRLQSLRNCIYPAAPRPGWRYAPRLCPFWTAYDLGPDGELALLAGLLGSGILPMRQRCPLPPKKGTLVAWIMVVTAGLLEMVWSYSAKQSNGFSNLGWAALTIVASLISFFLLTFAMRSLPLGTAYAVWTGIGAVGTFVVGIMLLGESAGALRIASALLIVAGVCGLRLTSSS